MSYEAEERQSSGGAVVVIIIVAVLALVFLVGGCAVVGGMYFMVQRPSQKSPSAVQEAYFERAATYSNLKSRLEGSIDLANGDSAVISVVRSEKVCLEGYTLFVLVIKTKAGAEDALEFYKKQISDKTVPVKASTIQSVLEEKIRISRYPQILKATVEMATGGCAMNGIVIFFYDDASMPHAKG
jgi:hypothetical protein